MWDLSHSDPLLIASDLQVQNLWVGDTTGAISSAPPTLNQTLFYQPQKPNTSLSLSPPIVGPHCLTRGLTLSCNNFQWLGILPDVTTPCSLTSVGSTPTMQRTLLINRTETAPEKVTLPSSLGWKSHFCHLKPPPCPSQTCVLSLSNLGHKDIESAWLSDLSKRGGTETFLAASTQGKLGSSLPSLPWLWSPLGVSQLSMQYSKILLNFSSNLFLPKPWKYTGSNHLRRENCQIKHK